MTAPNGVGRPVTASAAPSDLSAEALTVTGQHDLSSAAAVERLRRSIDTVFFRYGLPAGTQVRLLNVSENATFLLEPPEGPSRVLRVHRADYQSPAEIRSELAWIDALRREHTVPTVIPIAADDGELVVLLNDSGCAEPRPVVMFEHISGREPLGDDVAGFELLGETAARLHLHARRWQPPPGFTRFRWDYDGAFGGTARWGRWQHGLGVGRAESEVLTRLDAVLRARLAAFGTGPDVFHLIHADMRLANLIVDDTGVTHVIDFDDCGGGWYLYDLGSALSFFEHQPHVPELIDAWLRGYRKVLPVPAEHEREIPTFVMMRRLLLTAWISTHAETPTGREMGAPFTADTVRLADAYLETHGRVT